MSKTRCYLEDGAFTINFDVERYSKDKQVIADSIGYDVINQMQSAFKWNGLPDTIPQKWLECQLLVNGFSYITKVNGELYAFYGGLGGEPDAYYQPTICVVANPALNFNKTCKIGEDGVLINNDPLRRGIIPVVGKYAGLLAENTITLRIAGVMSRLTNVISASDESTVESVKGYLSQLEEGTLGVIEESAFLEDLKVQIAASSGNTRLTDLIEVDNYYLASLYSRLGLRKNDNMKRESISKAEGSLGDDVIQPLIDIMLKERQEAAEKINEMFGTNITVELAGAWAKNDEERELNLDLLESEVKENESNDSTDDSSGISDRGDNDESKEEETGGMDSDDGRSDDDEDGSVSEDEVFK